MTKDSYKPTHLDLMWPTLMALKTLGGSGTNEEIFDKIIELKKYSEEIQSVPHGDGRISKLEYRAAWARTWLKNLGAISNSGVGVWSITNLGEKFNSEEELLAKTKEDARVRYVKRKVIKSIQDTTSSLTNALEPISEEELEEELVADWKAQLLSVLIKVEPSAFERLCQRILREAGFIKVQVTGKSGDGGIDGIGVLRINLLSFQVFFQCKRYQGSVGAGAVRDFRGAMIGRCDKGLIITTGSFTSEARKEATRDGAPAIDLIDGNELCELLKKHVLGVKTEVSEKVTIEPEWFQKI